MDIYSEPYGERYEGIFENGLRQGAGKQTYQNGRLYDGQWRNSKRWGQGTLTSQSDYPAYGERYAGDFEADQMHGQGVYSWPTGARFSGLSTRDGAPSSTGPGLVRTTVRLPCCSK